MKQDNKEKDRLFIKYSKNDNYDRVEHIEDDVESEQSSKEAKKELEVKSLAVVSAIIIIGALGAKYIPKKMVKNIINPNTTITVSENNEPTTDAMVIINNENTSDAMVIINSESNDDINNKQNMQNVANKVWNNILEIRKNDKSYAANIDQNYVYELVRYARHNESGYTGGYVITNENAYGAFASLAKDKKINISTLFEGTSSYEQLNNLSNAFQNIVNDNSYDDEYNAYQAINDSINNTINYSNYPQVIATIALTDIFIDEPSMQLMRNGAKENGNEGTDYNNEKNSIDQNKRIECNLIFNNIDKNSSSYVFGDAVDKALEEDTIIDNIQNNQVANNTEINYNSADTFYNQILNYKKTYGNAFSAQITSVDYVKQIISFINEFNDEYKANGCVSVINSRELFETLISSYYTSCANYGVDPNRIILFNNSEYQAKTLAESEILAANLKNGHGSDYTIANSYYEWYAVNVCDGDTSIDISNKENAPMIDTLINEFKAYRGVGNMIAARKNQKTVKNITEQDADSTLDINGKYAWACPDAIDNYIINQDVIKADGTNSMTMQTVFDNIDSECESRTR